MSITSAKILEFDQLPMVSTVFGVHSSPSDSSSRQILPSHQKQRKSVRSL